ncbi:hypothetical protein [Natrarchaeobius chitinivorans]|nr:hypothetical protein [Natrarchaeobius chitinivorans]
MTTDIDGASYWSSSTTSLARSNNPANYAFLMFGVVAAVLMLVLAGTV